jgi:hypothetical protein
MERATIVCAALVLGALGVIRGQEPARADGWVVISVEEYRALRLSAYPPNPPPDPPPVAATVTRIEYDLRAGADSMAGETRLTIDVLKEGWVRIEVPPGLLVRAARLDGKPVSIVDLPPDLKAGPARIGPARIGPAGVGPAGPDIRRDMPARDDVRRDVTPHVLLSKPGRAVLALDVVVPLKLTAGSETLALPASPGAVSRVALVVPRTGIDLTVSGGVLAERAQEPEGRWVAYGRAGQPLSVTWKKRTDDARGTQPLKWRGSVTELVGLGEETSSVSATVRMDVVQGHASAIDITVADTLVINQVSGALVSDWEFRPGTLKVNFLEPIGAQTSFGISGEARVAREGSVPVPLVRLPGAERETGGVAVEVLGAGEIRDSQPRGLDPADPSDLGDPVSGRESPSMVAFRFRPQAGNAARTLALTVARYTPQAVLIANVEEARYDALAGEEGKTLVRARYAVRNNQRAFLDVRLPQAATLWSASSGARPVRPGVSPAGSLLLPLQKGRAGEEAPVFVVEVTYVQRGQAWTDDGRTALALPAIDLPISRSGVVLHYSPRFTVKPEPGAFHVEADAGPFTAALREDRPGEITAALGGIPEAPAARPAPAPSAVDQLVTQYRKDTAGRSVTGPVPVQVPFPDFGQTVFLMSELTEESQAPSLQFSYKRLSRW